MISLSFLILSSVFFTSSNLVPNGGFEAGLSEWGEIWTRQPGVGRVVLDDEIRHSGGYSARIEHKGERDWSFDPNARIQVQSGDLFELQAWVKVEGQGEATLCVVTYDERGEVIKWIFARRSLRGPSDWRQLRARFAIPQNVAQIHPRLIGDGTAVVWLDDFSLEKEGNVMAMQDKEMPSQLTLNNTAISVTLHTSDGTLSVFDKRTGQTWGQHYLARDVIIKNAVRSEAIHRRNESRQTDDKIEMNLFHAPSGLDVKAVLSLDNDLPEFTVELSVRSKAIHRRPADGELPEPLRFPHPFVSEPGAYLVVPMNEGISYPVDDESIPPMRLIAYGGHGICMAFWGVTDGERGYMAIIETPDDAAIRIDRLDGKLCIAPEWDSQRGKFGYTRRLRYVFLENGGHVAICKRYRAYSKKIGVFKTLEQKREENSNVDLLIGAVNVWCWEQDALSIVREMKSLGIERILWSHREKPDMIRAMNEMGILTSRYDIYQDVMNPENFKFLRGVHPDWPTEAWPKDIMIGPDGDWIKGWRVKGKDGGWYPCGTLCDKQALKYAQKRIPDELKTHPYRCRFIDTTTASPWRECYHPDHPMTRSESRHWKMELLRYVSEAMKLVTGSETGHDAAVPYIHYFEGMLSLGPYRVPDAGRDMLKIWDEVPERVSKFQMGHKYRLPLWELVYHD
ncbi:MAG: glycoside hydrolase, partial [Candidatus Poribacteria bacterium]